MARPRAKIKAKTKAKMKKPAARRPVKKAPAKRAAKKPAKKPSRKPAQKTRKKPAARPRAALGRGLAALLGDSPLLAAQGGAGAQPLPASLPAPVGVPLARIRPDPAQPRRHFAPAELAQLSASISRNGVLQPVLLRLAQDSAAVRDYILVAGERRFRAAQMAGLREIPAIVGAFSPREALEIALVENLQRQDLNPVEEARAFVRLTEEFGHSASQIGASVSKSRAQIANMMRLLKLPAPVLALVEKGVLTAGHGRALLASSNPAALAKRIQREGLTVRQLEKLARPSPVSSLAHSPARSAARFDLANADARALVKKLERQLGLKVILRTEAGGRWRLSFAGRTGDQLDALAARFDSPQ